MESDDLVGGFKPLNWKHLGREVGMIPILPVGRWLRVVRLPASFSHHVRDQVREWKTRVSRFCRKPQSHFAKCVLEDCNGFEPEEDWNLKWRRVSYSQPRGICPAVLLRTGSPPPNNFEHSRCHGAGGFCVPSAADHRNNIKLKSTGVPSFAEIIICG